MVRLTAELLVRVPGRMNTNSDRELCLRGMKVSVIENLAALQDQFDLIDLSDNEIVKLDNFPLMPRLGSLFVCNNYVSRISALGSQLPGLHSLVLTNNEVAYFADLKHLKSLPSLQYLSLLDNPVRSKPHYRAYLVHVLPGLKLLDFAKVSGGERAAAQRLFSGAVGAALLEGIESDAFVPGVGEGAPTVLTPEQKQQVRLAIEQATTREQIDTIERQLKTGSFPFAAEESSVGGKRKAEGDGKEEGGGKEEGDRLRKERAALVA